MITSTFPTTTPPTRPDRPSLPMRLTTATVLAVALAAGGLGVGTASAATPAPESGRTVHMNWFSDWQTCIWGVGTPTALAWRYPGTAKKIAYTVIRSRDRQGLVRTYGERTISACERFLRS